MNDFNQPFIARHVHGGLKCFADHHEDVAQFFPDMLWGPITSHLVRAQWCVIAGANRMKHLYKPTLLGHSGNAFDSLLTKYPGLENRYLPRLWWPSVIKRGVNTLWPELLRFEAAGARPTDLSFRCDRCKRMAAGSKQSA